MRCRQTALLVFARAPRPGHTKTRLIPSLGAEGAARLHARMVEHAVHAATSSSLGPVTLLAAPDPDDTFFSNLQTRYGCALGVQCAGDLGARMHWALHAALVTRDRAILIGSDCPSLSAADVRDADRLLELGADVVLGPALDGGYVLVGMRDAQPSLFADVAWGTQTVMRQTRDRLRAAALEWKELPPRRDIDDADDLRHLPADWLSTR